MANLWNYILPFKIIFLNQIALPTTSKTVTSKSNPLPFPQRERLHPSSVKSAAAAQPPRWSIAGLQPASSVYLAGVLDAQKGHAHPERGHPDVHLGSKVPSDPSGQVWELDPADQVAPGPGLGGLRVPGQHRAQDVVELHPQRGRWVKYCE